MNRISRIILLAAALLTGSLAATASSKGQEILDRVKKEMAPDSRQAVFELKIDKQRGRTAVLTGVTSDSAALCAATGALDAAGIRYHNEATVYPSDRMGLIRIPVASLRTRGAHAGEMATQAVMGTPVRILDNTGEWWRVQTPDGYIAWVPDSSVAPKTAEEMDAWRSNDRRMTVGSLWQTRAYSSPTAGGPRDVVTDLVLGAIVEADTTLAPIGSRIAIVLPDGRRAWADAADLTAIEAWADQPFDAVKILDTAYSLEGSPYLWGGTSVKSVDCSGLAKVSYLHNGIILRRDASQQALTGQRLEADAWPEYQPGDLMFFGNRETGRVTHVAIYDHDGRYIHSSGRVKRNSVDPASPDYLYSPLHSVRIHGMEGTDGITRAIDHPWYFNKK